MTWRMLAHKVILRSGWDPDDFYMMIEVFPRHTPLNPTAIVGLMSGGSAMAFMEPEKWVSRENMVQIEDPDGRASFMGVPHNTAPRELPSGYMGMETQIPCFSDHRLATRVRLKTTNYMGYAATHEREVFFIKNRFAVVRDLTSFNDAFRCRIGPVWNTQHTETIAGASWVNTWFEKMNFYKTCLYKNPRRDLLVYYLPSADCHMTIAERPDLVTSTVATRYEWEGDVQPGIVVRFSQVLLPHDPSVKAEKLAAGIVVAHENESGLFIKVEAEPGRHEWVMLNAPGASYQLPVSSLRQFPELAGFTTDARAVYLDFQSGKLRRLLVEDATKLRIGGRTLVNGKSKRTTLEMLF